MESDYELVRVAAMKSSPEAHVLRVTLNHAGIPARVTSEQSANTLGVGALIPAEVYVRRIDEEQAKAIVAEFLSQPVEPVAAWTCSCGEEIDEGFGSCWSCGRDLEQRGGE